MPRPSTGPRPPAPGGPGPSAGAAADSIAGRVTGLTPPPAAEPSRVFLGAAYVFALLLGVGLGLYGVAAVPAGPRIGGALISIGLFVAVIGNTGAALLARWLTGTRLGALMVLVGWAPVVLALGSSRPEGDLMLRASGNGYAFLLLGALTPVAVGVIGRPRRGLTALTLPPPPSKPR